jgi:hypothetical protein
MKSGSLNLLEPYGPVQAFTGVALLSHTNIMHKRDTIYYSNLLFNICGEMKELWEGIVMNKLKKKISTNSPRFTHQRRADKYVCWVQITNICKNK